MINNFPERFKKIKEENAELDELSFINGLHVIKEEGQPDKIVFRNVG